MFWNKTPKILIVEDELHNHSIYRDAFGAAGFEVIICQTADDDFVGEVVAYKPDIISMDLMIGKENAVTERDGFQAIELLKADVRTKDIPVFVLTNFFQEDKVRHAKELGADDYINVQGQPLPKIAELYRDYLKNPKRYVPSHPIFLEE